MLQAILVTGSEDSDHAVECLSDYVMELKLVTEYVEHAVVCVILHVRLFDSDIVLFVLCTEFQCLLPSTSGMHFSILALCKCNTGVHELSMTQMTQRIQTGQSTA